jgi:hypothetical protein
VSTTVVFVIVAVGVGSTLLLLAMVWGLIRHLKVLTGALGRYRDEVQPLLEQITADADTASRRAGEVPSRVPRPGPGARLRKSS